MAADEMNARLIASELKVAAIDAGLIDLDTLKLIDTSSVTMNDRGELQGHHLAFEAAKISKPHLFKAGTMKSAVAMTDEEYRVAKARLINGR